MVRTSPRGKCRFRTYILETREDNNDMENQELGLRVLDYSRGGATKNRVSGWFFVLICRLILGDETILRPL